MPDAPPPPATPDVAASHVGLCTPDLDASLRFFVQGLGFEAADGWDLDSETLPGLPHALEVEPEPDRPLAVRSQLVRLGNFAVELLAFDSPATVGAASTSRGSIGLTHLAFWVEDLDATLESAVEAGATLLDRTRADLGVQLVFLADPAGVRIELMQRPR